MSICNISDRLKKLRDLREQLCSKEKNWEEAFNLRDWIVDQIKETHKLSESKNSTKQDIIERLADILCVLDPKDGSSNVK